MLLITAGDDSRPVNGSNQHVGLVKALDYDDPDLTEWEILGYCVAQTAEMGTPGEFRDAQCFSVGDERYMVVGGADNGQGVAHVFKTTAGTLTEWEAAVADNALNGLSWTYMGSLFGDYYDTHNYKNDYGTVWEMPNLAPLPDKDGNATGKYLFVFSPQYGDNDVWYYIGEFDPDTCRFTPDFEEARLMDYGNNIFTGPTVYVNDDGRVYLASIMQENTAGDYVWKVEDRIASGWAFYAGLPRELYLRDDGDLGIRHVDTAPIEGETIVSFENLTAEAANEKLAAVDSDTIKIEFTFTGTAKEFGFKLKNGDEGFTRFFVNDAAMGLDGQSGAYTKGDTVTGVIYVDKCSIEAYVDEYKTVSGSKFFKGSGVEVFIDGEGTCTVTVTEMNTIRDTEPEQEPVKGDLNGDGRADNRDVIMLARHLVHIITLDENQQALADMNGNKKLTNLDLVLLARKTVEK
jgi:sucrose-6-phosphate hydrolase SacC (GH32 family)